MILIDVNVLVCVFRRDAVQHNEFRRWLNRRLFRRAGHRIGKRVDQHGLGLQPFSGPALAPPVGIKSLEYIARDLDRIAGQCQL